MSNVKRTVFYIGITNNLQRRLFEHRNELIKGFTKRYAVKFLIYIEQFKEVEDAITREKQLKNWKRQWKINLVKISNPNFTDLSERLI